VRRILIGCGFVAATPHVNESELSGEVASGQQHAEKTGRNEFVGERKIA
jgi:hypothetical protein